MNPFLFLKGSLSDVPGFDVAEDVKTLVTS